MSTRWICASRGFSLLELIVVVVVIGIVAAIAIPRLSRGAAGATEAAVASDLTSLRKALDLFQAEHNGSFPDATNVAAQLTQYTDITGAVSPTKDAAHLYGPYIRSIPPLPVGLRKGQNGIAAADGATIGWIYNAAAGMIQTNTTTETDSSGNLYTSYGDGPAFGSSPKPVRPPVVSPYQ